MRYRAIKHLGAPEKFQSRQAFLLNRCTRISQHAEHESSAVHISHQTRPPSSAVTMNGDNYSSRGSYPATLAAQVGSNAKETDSGRHGSSRDYQVFAPL